METEVKVGGGLGCWPPKEVVGDGGLLRVLVSCRLVKGFGVECCLRVS